MYTEIQVDILIAFGQFKSGDFVFMQDSAPCSAYWANTSQDDLRNAVPDFAVETTSGSIVAVTKHDGNQFNTFSVKRLFSLLITLCFFLHFDM